MIEHSLRVQSWKQQTSSGSQDCVRKGGPREPERMSRSLGECGRVPGGGMQQRKTYRDGGIPSHVITTVSSLDRIRHYLYEMAAFLEFKTFLCFEKIFQS